MLETWFSSFFLEMFGQIVVQQLVEDILFKLGLDQIFVRNLERLTKIELFHIFIFCSSPVLTFMGKMCIRLINPSRNI